MLPTLLVIIATSITISHGHDGSQDQNIVTTITGQDINTSRVKRFLTGTRYTSYPGKPGYAQNGTNGYNYNVVTPGFNRNQNTTQHYVNPVQNYNYSQPGYYPNNGNTNNIKPVYPTPPTNPQYPSNSSGYPIPYPPPNIKPYNPTQYPGNSSVYPAPYPQPSNNKPVYPTPQGYPQYPSNSSGYPAPYPQPSNNKPVYPTPQGYPQYPSNSSGYPIPYPPPNINIPTTKAPWVRPPQNNNAAYPAYNTTKPGYNNAVKYNMCRSNSTTGAQSIDACIIQGGSANCPEGMRRVGDYCMQDLDEY